MGVQGGLVVSAMDVVRGHKVAIKKLVKPFQNEMYAKRAFRELCLIKMVNHKNIIGLLNIFTPAALMGDFENVYIVMELMDANFCSVIGIDLDHDRMSYLLYQLMCGIKHLHSAGIIVRNLSPRSILVKDDCSLKIADFGLVRTEVQLKSYYNAPEIMLNVKYNENVDMWNVGCIFGELVKGEILFCGRDYVDQWDKIFKKLGTPEKDIFSCVEESKRLFCESLPKHEGIPWQEFFPDQNFPQNEREDSMRTSQARDLLSKMLQIDPTKRITVQQALAHPYVNIWYDELDIEQAMTQYDHSLEERNIPLNQWKGLIYDEVLSFKENLSQ